MSMFDEKPVLKYFRKRHDEAEYTEVSYEEALHSLLTTFKDNDITRDWLTVANYLPYRFGVISVHECYGNGYEMTLMAGLSHMSPMGAEYDDNGNRIK